MTINYTPLGETLAFIDRTIREITATVEHFDGVIRDYRASINDPSVTGPEKEYLRRKMIAKVADRDETEKYLRSWILFRELLPSVQPPEGE